MIVLAASIFCLVLLLVSAFFSAAETGLVALVPQKAKRLALRSPHLANELAVWLRQPHELMTTILIGNTLVNVMFAAVGTTLAVRMFKSVPRTRVEFTAWIVETVCLVMLAEMAPKFVARAMPEKTSLLVLPWLSRLRNLLSPFLNVVSKIAGSLSPAWRASPVSSLLTFSLDELKGLLEEERPGAGVGQDSLGMMQRALDIHARRAVDIMTPLSKVDWVEIDPPGKPPRDRELLMDLVVEHGHTRTPVKKQGEFIGFLHSADLLPYILHDRGGGDLTVLVRKAWNVAPDRPVSDLLHDFQSGGIHMGFVRDAAGAMIGIVTLEDVLEEITGEILDEYDHP